VIAPKAASKLACMAMSKAGSSMPATITTARESVNQTGDA
jgi:hypothetical protein